MIVPLELESLLLESALDEDPVLSAIDNISSSKKFKRNEIIDACEDICQKGFIGFYTYENGNIIEVSSAQFREKLTELEFDLFLVQSDSTFGRLAEISSPSV